MRILLLSDLIVRVLIEFNSCEWGIISPIFVSIPGNLRLGDFFKTCAIKTDKYAQDIYSSHKGWHTRVHDYRFAPAYRLYWHELPPKEMRAGGRRNEQNRFSILQVGDSILCSLRSHKRKSKTLPRRTFLRYEVGRTGRNESTKAISVLVIISVDYRVASSLR